MAVGIVPRFNGQLLMRDFLPETARHTRTWCYCPIKKAKKLRLVRGVRDDPSSIPMPEELVASTCISVPEYHAQLWADTRNPGSEHQTPRRWSALPTRYGAPGTRAPVSVGDSWPRPWQLTDFLAVWKPPSLPNTRTDCDTSSIRPPAPATSPELPSRAGGPRWSAQQANAFLLPLVGQNQVRDGVNPLRSARTTAWV